MFQRIKSMCSSNVFLYLSGGIILALGGATLYLSKGLLNHHHNIGSPNHHINNIVEPLPSETHGTEIIAGQEELLLNAFIFIMALLGVFLLIIIGRQIRHFSAVDGERKKHVVFLERCLAALNASLDGVAIVEPDGALSYANESLFAMLGIEEGEHADHLEKDWKEIFAEKLDGQTQREINDFLKHEEGWGGSYSFLVRPESGEERNLCLSATALKDGSCICTIHDTTEEQLAQSEKEDLQNQFYQSQKMEAIGRLAGGIAHDFNNILAAINGYAEFLMDDLEEESPTHGFAKNILEAGLRARGLVDQMLAFSRRKDNDHETMDLTFSIKDTATMLQASLPKTIDVEQHINVDTARVSGNVSQITQVLMNLCVNASDAMEGKHGKLTLSIEEAKFIEFPMPKLFCNELADPAAIAPISFKEMDASRTVLCLGTIARSLDYYCLSIRDTGSGMSRTIMEHIFEPFFTTKPVDKGTGLGLAMVHAAVIAHRGCMVIDSALGTGTVFELYFPVDHSQSDDNIAEEKTDMQLPDDLMVLLVEDQKDVQEMTLKMLERIGVEAESACDGVEAMAILRENPGAFDLVVTDYNMPRMTGLELIQHAGLEFPDLPFILLSGYSQEKVSELIEEQENVMCTLRKPAGRDKLYQSILSSISKKQELAA